MENKGCGKIVEKVWKNCGKHETLTFWIFFERKKTSRNSLYCQSDLLKNPTSSACFSKHLVAKNRLVSKNLDDS